MNENEFYQTQCQSQKAFMKHQMQEKRLKKTDKYSPHESLRFYSSVKGSQVSMQPLIMARSCDVQGSAFSIATTGS